METLAVVRNKWGCLWKPEICASKHGCSRIKATCSEIRDLFTNSSLVRNLSLHSASVCRLCIHSLCGRIKYYTIFYPHASYSFPVDLSSNSDYPLNPCNPNNSNTEAKFSQRCVFESLDRFIPSIPFHIGDLRQYRPKFAHTFSASMTRKIRSEMIVLLLLCVSEYSIFLHSNVDTHAASMGT